MYHFVYKTTNLVNGKFYIGKHSTDNLDDGYLGSGRVLINAVKKYGKEFFKREIIKILDDENIAYEFEQNMLSVHMKNNLCYNLSGGGRGTGTGENHPNWGKRASKESRKKMSESRRGKTFSQETKNKMSKSRSGVKHFRWGKELSEEHKKKLSKSHTGKKLSNEAKEKLSKFFKGRPISDEHRRQLSEARKGRKFLKGKNHPLFGIPLSDDHKQKLRKSHLGKKHSKEGIKKMKDFWSSDKNPNIGKKRSDESRKRMSDAHKGQKISKEHLQKLIKINTGRPLAKEHRRKISKSNSKSIYQYCKKSGDFITEFCSGKVAVCVITGRKTSSGNLSECANGKKKSAYGFLWSYEKKENYFDGNRKNS